MVSKYKGKTKFDEIWGIKIGGALKRGQNISNFSTTYPRLMKFSEQANITKRSNLIKFEGIKMGGFPSNEVAKILNF